MARRRAGVVMLVTAAGIAAAGAVFNFLFMPFAVDHGTERVVPAVVGLPFPDAERLLAAQDLTAVQRTERVSPEWPRGVVLEQDPDPGFRTRPRRAVGLVVSAGKGEVEVPAIEGESLRHAEMILGRSGIPVGSLARRPAEKPDGQVLRVSPPAGTRIARGQPVSLLLSAGGGRQAFLVPDLRGGNVTDVERALTDAGFRVEVVRPVGSCPMSGRIVGHSPPAGHRVQTGDLITLRTGGLR
jgi:serine/threonine-protein kinase